MGGAVLADADGRGERAEAGGRDVPAGAEEAAGAGRAVPEAAVRGGGVQPAARGAGAPLLAPARSAPVAVAAGREEDQAPPQGGAAAGALGKG